MGQTVGNAGHADHNQQDAQRIHRAGVRVLRFGHRHGGKDQEGHQDRQRHEEDGAPVEVLEQEATHDRTQRGTGGEAGCPHGDGDATLVRIRKDVTDNRQGRRHEHGTKNTEQGSSYHEQQRRGRKRRESGDNREAGRADEQQLAATDTVADSAHGHEQCGKDQRVGVNNPQLFSGGGAQRLSDSGHGKGQHGVVNGDQEHRQHEDGERGPALSLLLGGMDGQSRGLRVVIRHEVFRASFGFRLMWRTRARHQLGLSFLGWSGTVCSRRGPTGED